MLRLSAVFFTFLLVATSAHAAHLVVPFNREKLDTSARTHFVVTSRGGSLGMNPQLSGLTKASKLVDVYPNDQVVLLLHDETEWNLRWIQRNVSKAAYRVKGNFNATDLFNELEPYTQIVSIHTFGHSAITEGVFLGALGERDMRWYQNDKNSKRLVGHFTADAFVNLNGCNTGHSMASRLSLLWKVPVTGALTGTHFEALDTNGQFSISAITDESKWSKASEGIFRNTDTKCTRGCVRMRPDNVIYRGHYGNYTQGLGFYKTFCLGISQEDCLKGMARSIIATVTTKNVPARPTREQFAQAVREWMCPTGVMKIGLQSGCEAQLAAIDAHALPGFGGSTENGLFSDLFYTPFQGASFQCDFVSCYEKRECLKNAATTRSCAETEKPRKRTTTFVDEYFNFLKGYDLLRSEL